MQEKTYGEKIAEKYGVYLQQLRGENNRGSVIISSVILEDILQKMLETKLVPSVEKNDELFESVYAPINNFSAKIDLAYRVDLITHQVRSSLHLLRKTRNDFAHSKLVDGFEEDSVRSRIHELFKLNKNILDEIWKPFRKDEEFNEILSKEGIELSKPAKSINSFVEVIGWRGTFDQLAALTCARLEIGTEYVDPLPNHESS